MQSILVHHSQENDTTFAMCGIVSLQPCFVLFPDLNGQRARIDVKFEMKWARGRPPAEGLSAALIKYCTGAVDGAFTETKHAVGEHIDLATFQCPHTAADRRFITSTVLLQSSDIETWHLNCFLFQQVRDQPPSKSTSLTSSSKFVFLNWAGLHVCCRTPRISTSTYKDETQHPIHWSSMHSNVRPWNSTRWDERDKFTNRQKRSTVVILHVDDGRCRVALCICHKHHKCGHCCAENDSLLNKSANWSILFRSNSQPVQIDSVSSGNMPQIWASSLVNHLNHCRIVLKYK